MRPHLNRKKLGMVAGSIKWEEAGLGKKQDPISKITSE
jgi:hypothetical protein